MKLLMGIGVILVATVPVALAGSRVISASTEASGNQHPGTAAVSGPATVTCIFVAGTNATCFVTGPGVAQQIPKGGQVGTSGAGTVTLICNGSGALRCQARVDGAVVAKDKTKDEKKPDDNKTPQ